MAAALPSFRTYLFSNGELFIALVCLDDARRQARLQRAAESFVILANCRQAVANGHLRRLVVDGASSATHI